MIRITGFVKKFMNILHLFKQSDSIGRAVAILLLLMSIASWVVILWKAWLLRRARKNASAAIEAFWAAPSLENGAAHVTQLDRTELVTPLIAAIQTPKSGTLASTGTTTQQLTRLLRDALHGVQARLQFGQVLLATVGATSPFVGLLGTVWGIYHALTGIAGSGQLTIAQVAGPVGESLIMTAAGLAVAIPAVLAYNWYGRIVGNIQAQLEGFAFDLKQLLAPAQQS
jgi:biopolymer transport protein ExbB